MVLGLTATAGLSYVQFRGGRMRESDEALGELEEMHGADCSYQIAAIRSARGEADAALAWLERAFEDHDAGLSLLNSEPTFRGLHGDPRWIALLKKIGLAK